MFNWLKNVCLSLLMPSMSGSAGETTSAVLGNYTVQSGSDAIQYIAQKTLRIAHKVLRFYDLAEKAKLPSRESKTFQYTRYERLPLPIATLIETVSGTPATMAITTVEATAEQWGTFVTISDVAELTIKHSPFMKANELLGKNSGELVERECFNVLVTGTSIFFPGTITARSSITSTDVVGVDTWRRMVADIRNKGADGMQRSKDAEDNELGDEYIAVLDPFMEFDVSSDPDFIDSVKYAAAKRLWNGEIGKLVGTRFLRSNSLPTLVSSAAPTQATNEGGGNIPLRYVRTICVGYDTTFNYPTLITQAVENDLGAADTDDSVSVTTPNNSAYRWKIFTSNSASAGAATATKYRQAGSGFLAQNVTVEIGDTANANGTTIFALVTSGESAGSILAEMQSSASKVHVGFLFGREAYTVVDLQNLTSTLTPPGASTGDELGLKRSVGYKLMFKCVINNNNFFSRVEAESAFD